jgi:proteasome-associated ATPase
MENDTASAAEDMVAEANGMASAQDSVDAAQSPEELAAYNDRLMAKNHALAVALQRAGRELNKAKSQLAQLVQPPMTFAVMVRLDSSHTDEQGVRHASAEVISGARRMIVPVAANVNATRLAAGCTVLLNENMVLVDQRDVDGLGMVRRIAQILDGGRLVVADTSGNVSVVRRGSALSQIALSVGDRVSVDPSGRLALDELPNEDATELVLEETPNVTFDDIGGLDTQIERIRDAVQLPFLHRALFERYDLNPPKGVLLYGPPGNGKTLIAKAVAHALAEGSGTGSGVFLSVKGPELLNKFVGESERLIRIIFKRARERAESGRPVIVFIDEMDSLLRTRGSGVSSDVETTIVPQFLAELDGVEQLDNVIVIGASNRVDMIDPAVLRPGRLDVKIRVDRPGAAQAKQIVRHYLTDDLPLDPDMDADALAGILVSDIYAREERRHIADLRDEQGRWSPLYMADIVSGAMLRNIIDRAKTHAVKQSIESGSDIRLDAQLLGAAVEEEYGESADSVLDADAQQWSRINGVAGGRVVALRPAGVARS